MQIVVVPPWHPFVYYKFDADLSDINNPHQLNLSLATSEGGSQTHAFTSGKIGNSFQPTYLQPGNYLELDNTDSPIPLTWELDKDSSGAQGVGFGIRLWFRMDDFQADPETKIPNPSYIRLSSLNPFYAWAVAINRIGATFFVSKPSEFGYDYTTAEIPVAVFDGGWHMIACTYDYVNNLVTIRLDDNPAVATVATDKILWNPTEDRFRIEFLGVSIVDPTWGPITFYAAIDEVAVYKNLVLTPAMMDEEWNAGSGRTWNGTGWIL